MYEYQASDIAELFKSFADATRIRILLALFETEKNVSEIVAAVGVSQTAVSHQLRALRQRHLVKCRRDGKQIIYSLADDHVKTIIRTAVEHIEE